MGRAIQNVPTTFEGSSTGGLGLACTDLYGGGIDYAFAWVDDPGGANVIYYRVGENVPSGGIVTTWVPVPGPD